MRVLVTGGAGFIGSHFVRRLAAAGDEVVVLDKLTYAGNRGEPRGRRARVPPGRHRRPGRGRGGAQGCEAIVNFAAESHVDRSILGPAEFILTDVLGTQVLLDHARHAGIRLVQVSTDEVYGDIPLDAMPCSRGRAASALEPVLGVEGRRRPPGARLRPHLRRRRLDHARREQLRPAPVPREAHPALHHERVRRHAAAGLRRRPAAPRVAARRGPLLGDRARAARSAARARSTTSAARSARTWTSCGRSST